MKHRYLQSNVTIDGFNMTADLALTSEQREKGLSVKDKLTIGNKTSIKKYSEGSR